MGQLSLACGPAKHHNEEGERGFKWSPMERAVKEKKI